jgi:hypothetical protein
MMGHSSFKTTMDIYGHVNQDIQDSAIAIINSIRKE